VAHLSVHNVIHNNLLDSVVVHEPVTGAFFICSFVGAFNRAPNISSNRATGGDSAHALLPVVPIIVGKVFAFGDLCEARKILETDKFDVRSVTIR
jgi:hypothetical protein